MKDKPLVTTKVVLTPDGCEYGGKASCLILLAGKVLLRFEAPDINTAEIYERHLEWTEPAWNEFHHNGTIANNQDNSGTWEFTLFHDSGFTTLYLSSNHPKVYVHWSIGYEPKNTETLLPRLAEAYSSIVAAAAHTGRRVGKKSATHRYAAEVLRQLYDGESIPEPNLRIERNMPRGYFK